MTFLCPFAFVTRRIEYKHLRCAQNIIYYELNLIFFRLFLCLCKFNRSSKFKRILNANTHSIRITNADGQGGSSKIYRRAKKYAMKVELLRLQLLQTIE